jgi:iron complex transport system permease protein
MVTASSLAGLRGLVLLGLAFQLSTLLLVLADALVRAMPTVSELRLGIAMSMLGGPFFLALLLKMRRGLA